MLTGQPNRFANEAELSAKIERLQQELRKTKSNERRYRDFFTRATDLVFTVDRRGLFRQGNDHFFDLTGYTVEEGLNLDWNQVVAPHEWNRATQIYRDHAAGEEALFFELDIVTKHGELRTIEIHSRPVLYKSKVIGFHGIARDISERKRTEKSLEQVRIRAEAAEQFKTRLLAKVSHEIRTPLHGVMNLLTAIDTSQLSEADQKMVAPIDRSIRHLIHLVDDTLNFAYLESGQSTVRNISFSIAQITKACAARHKHMAEQKSLFLHLNLDSKLPERISGDATKITQILDNLITNAIRYTSTGGVTIKILDDNEHKPESGLTVVVSDTGPGISEQQIDQIFEPFQQISADQDGTNGGVGLGLAITKQLVETLGCKLTIESTIGDGSHFTLTIPKAAPISYKTGSQTADSFDGTSLKALVIDDDEVSSIFLMDTLTATGIEAEACTSGKEAQRLMQSQNYDLVFTDQHLSDILGSDLAKQLRSNIRIQEYKIICITADIELHQMQDHESPFDQILLKPCSQNDLTSSLAELFPSRSSVQTSGILDESAGISLASGNRHTWEKALGIFNDKLPLSIDQLDMHQKNKDWEELRRTAHKLAGSSRYIEAQNLADSSIELVDACKIKDLASIDIAFKSLMLATAELEMAAKGLASNETQKTDSE
ncbi:MAG: PAS domain S-box protein [Proteobacteria bacterium]|nr:PAS domain S-box protein [Pseudomonadota bacterium]